MKITILFDNTIFEGGLESGWGFSSLVEVEGTPKILFDTGGNGMTLLSNMKKLNIDPDSIDEVFISHAHHDHVGGLSDFLAENSNVKLFVPPSFSPPRAERETVEVQKPQQLHRNVYSTGELSGVEQSLAVKAEQGIVVVVGCSHPPMNNILEKASKFGKPYGIVGGLHGTHPDSLKGLDLICATHCTRHKKEIKSRFSDSYVEGGVGKIIEI